MAEHFARVLTYVEAISEALREEMERDERVVVLRSAWGEAPEEDSGAVMGTPREDGLPLAGCAERRTAPGAGVHVLKNCAEGQRWGEGRS